jgi:hypothetical protein
MWLFNRYMRAPTQLYRHQRVIIHIIPPRLYYYITNGLSAATQQQPYRTWKRDIYTYIRRCAFFKGCWWWWRCLGSDDVLFNSYWQPKGESSSTQNPKYILRYYIYAACAAVWLYTCFSTNSKIHIDIWPLTIWIAAAGRVYTYIDILDSHRNT